MVNTELLARGRGGVTAELATGKGDRMAKRGVRRPAVSCSYVTIAQAHRPCRGCTCERCESCILRCVREGGAKNDRPGGEHCQVHRGGSGGFLSEAEV